MDPRVSGDNYLIKGPQVSNNPPTSLLDGCLYASTPSSLILLGQETSSNQEDATYQLEALSGRWQIYLATLYSLTAVCSFTLNMVTVIVLLRSRRSELKKYLINLSVSDLFISLFSIPFTYTEYMFGRWVFAAFLCPLVRLMATLSVFVSAATMTVIGINRHLAIIYPLRKKKFYRWTLRKTHVILAIWFVGLAISLPEFLMFSAQPFCYNKQLYLDCRQSWPDSVNSVYSLLIGLKLWRRQIPGNIDVNRDLTMQTQRVKIIKMLFVVVIMFAVSWLPLQTFSVVMFLIPSARDGYEYQSMGYNIFVGTYFACHWLSMAHSCLNPLIYCFMNDRFRVDLQMLLFRRKIETASSAASLFGASSAPANRPESPQTFQEEQARRFWDNNQPTKVELQVQVELDSHQGHLDGAQMEPTDLSSTSCRVVHFNQELRDGATGNGRGHLIALAAEPSLLSHQASGKGGRSSSKSCLFRYNSSKGELVRGAAQRLGGQARQVDRRPDVSSATCSSVQQNGKTKTIEQVAIGTGSLIVRLAAPNIGHFGGRSSNRDTELAIDEEEEEDEEEEVDESRQSISHDSRSARQVPL